MHGREGMLAQDRELDRVRHAVLAVKHAGMQPNAGHALSYSNVGAIAGLESVHELHIGHAIISRAIYVGLRQATREMKEAIAIAARSASEE
jgi:pyridoxine 5-phosphate synthase